ncbi:camp-dependent protein kinase catalytic subunit [Nowakowskiella sp. JEL0407]|nr:camp-dependent protein kinase catalytic subunit [Nowakowskiella sp. JEL0407]
MGLKLSAPLTQEGIQEPSVRRINFFQKRKSSKYSSRKGDAAKDTQQTIFGSISQIDLGIAKTLVENIEQRLNVLELQDAQNTQAFDNQKEEILKNLQDENESLVIKVKTLEGSFAKIQTAKPISIKNLITSASSSTDVESGTDSGNSIADSIENDYLRQAPVGRGGYGKVYRVQELESGKVVAMTLIKRNIFDDDFCEEAEILKSMQNLFIVDFLGSHTSPNHHRIFMEYFSEATLRRYISQVSTLPNHITKFLAAEILLGLNYIYKQGFVLRGLKDHNIMITIRRHLKLIDMGLAASISKCTNLQTKGSSCGTIPYMSPEVASGFKTYDHVSDFWGFGAVLYKMVTGKTPYKYTSRIDHYKNTVSVVVSYEDSNFTLESKDICSKLLCKASERLRAERNGLTISIFDHWFFSGICWDDFQIWRSPLTNQLPIE